MIFIYSYIPYTILKTLQNHLHSFMQTKDRLHKAHPLGNKDTFL